MQLQAVAGLQPFTITKSTISVRAWKQRFPCRVSASKDLLNSDQSAKALQIQLERAQARSAGTAQPAATAQIDRSADEGGLFMKSLYVY